MTGPRDGGAGDHRRAGRAVGGRWADRPSSAAGAGAQPARGEPAPLLGGEPEAEDAQGEPGRGADAR